MTSKGDATAEGVAGAWSDWLNEHPVSIPELITKALGTAFSVWLDDHTDDLIDAIADAAQPVGARTTPPDTAGPRVVAALPGGGWTFKRDGYKERLPVHMWLVYDNGRTQPVGVDFDGMTWDIAGDETCSAFRPPRAADPS